MPTTTLSDQRQTLIKTARAIVDAAIAGNRELTSDEHSKVDALTTEVKSIDAKLESGKYVKAVLALGGAESPDPDGGPVASSLFDPETRAALVKAVRTRTSCRVNLDAKAVVRLGSKAALTSGGLIPTSGTYVEPGLHPTGAFPLSSLFVQQPALGPVVRYYRMGAGTAAVVAEGAAKPDAGIGITPIDLVLEKIAALAQVSDEMGEDAPYLVQYVSAELQAAVATVENARILAAFEGAAGHLTGGGAVGSVVDIIADAIALAEATSGATPNAVIAHPDVVAAVRKAKASTAGTYMIDPRLPGPTVIHGVPVYSTPATASGVAWIVETSGVTIYRRGPLTVDVGTNDDDFAHNLRTLRAEERLGTAVTRPTALTKLTLTSTFAAMATSGDGDAPATSRHRTKS